MKESRYGSEVSATFYEYEFSVILLTRNRIHDLRKALESLSFFEERNWELVLVDNASGEETRKEMTSLLERLAFQNVKLVLLDENLGVAGGRNIGIERASGKYLFFLDDDAQIIEKDFLTRCKKHFDDNCEIGVLACNIVNTTTGRLQIGRRFKHKGVDCVLTFRGGGCVIRNDLFRSGMLPLFPPTLFYGAEEEFLSYIVYDLGLIIRLCFDLVVLHNPSSSTRLERKRVVYNGIVNKAVINTLLFPEEYARKIKRAMIMRLVKHLWKYPSLLYQARKLFMARIEESSRPRTLSETTVQFIKTIYPHVF